MKRRYFKFSMAWQWVKTNCPEVACACEDEAARKFPKLLSNGRASSDEVVAAVKKIKFTGKIHAK